jgi:hypothetical protein
MADCFADHSSFKDLRGMVGCWAREVNETAGG